MAGGRGDVSTCSDPDKVRYRSERAARAAVKAVKRRRRDGAGFLHAYRCGSHWHIGHGHKSVPTETGKRFR